MPRIYLDYQNGTPLLPEALTAIQEVLPLVANPSSLHSDGRTAARWREQARAQVAALVGARVEEVYFTSSGTEGNTWALTGLAEAYRSRGRHLVVSAVEHLSILQMVRRMEKEDWGVTVLPVDRNGRVDPERVEQALTPKITLVSLQWANSEVGTLQLVAEIARRVKGKGILLHADAVAAAGQVPIDLRTIPVDALSLAGNTFGGPPGIGALILRKGVRILPLLVGGTQEDGRRAGTENLLGIVGMGAASAAALRDLPALAEKVTPLRERLIRGILKLLPEATLNGHPTERLPGHVSVSIPGVDAEALVLALDREGVSVGLGSACTSRTMKASHVLRAMGIEESRARGTITCTLGSGTTAAEIDRLLELLPHAIEREISKA